MKIPRGLYGRHLRFSLGEILLIITALGLLIGANVSPYDTSHPLGPPTEGRGWKPVTRFSRA